MHEPALSDQLLRVLMRVAGRGEDEASSSARDEPPLARVIQSVDLLVLVAMTADLPSLSLVSKAFNEGVAQLVNLWRTQLSGAPDFQVEHYAVPLPTHAAYQLRRQTLAAVRFTHLPSQSSITVQGVASRVPDRPTMQAFTSDFSCHEMSEGRVSVVDGTAYAGWVRTPDENENAVTLLPAYQEWRALRLCVRGLDWKSARRPMPRFVDERGCDVSDESAWLKRNAIELNAPWPGARAAGEKFASERE